MPGFPNLFLTYGPNTNLAHGGSIIFHTECQVRYITQAFREMIENGYSTLEVLARGRATVHLAGENQAHPRAAGDNSGPDGGSAL